MGFIQAPSYKPPQQFDMWGGIADIIGDIASNREYKRQVERQRIADAQRAAAHGSQQRGRSLANQLKQEQLNTYRKSVEHLEWDPNNYDALINQAKKTGNWGSLAGVLPKNVVINLKGLTEYQNKIDLGIQRAAAAKNAEAEAALRIEKSNADLKYKNEIYKINLKTGSSRLRTAESTAREAEGTEQPNIDYAKIRAENALRKQQADIKKAGDLSRVENILRGRGELPVQTQVGPESFQTSQQPITPGSGLYNQAILDWSVLGNPSANQLKSVRQHAGLADAASGRTAIPDTMTKKQHQDSLAATMLEEIKVRPDYHEKAFDEDEINRARDNILRAAKQIAIASGDSSLDNQWKIAYILSKNFNSGFKKGEKVAPWLSKNYQDYTPMSTDDIVTAYKKGTQQGNEKQTTANQATVGNQDRVVYTTKSGRNITLNELQIKARQMSQQSGQPVTPLQVLNIIKQSGK